MTVRTGRAVRSFFVHDFLVGWMNLNSIVLCNNPAAGPCTGPTTDVINDMAGAATPNILEANVTGNIPLLQDFNELGIGHPITLPDGSSVNGVVLPDDWATLATSRLATVQGPLSDPTSFWDTHDDWLATEGHAQESPASICQPRVTTGIDAVDQCTDTGDLALADEAGGFSAIWTFGAADGLSNSPRTARSIRPGPDRPTSPTARSTRATRRCLPLGSTSRSLRTPGGRRTSPAWGRSRRSTRVCARASRRLNDAPQAAGGEPACSVRLHELAVCAAGRDHASPPVCAVLSRVPARDAGSRRSVLERHRRRLRE